MTRCANLHKIKRFHSFEINSADVPTLRHKLVLGRASSKPNLRRDYRSCHYVVQSEEHTPPPAKFAFNKLREEVLRQPVSEYEALVGKGKARWSSLRMAAALRSASPAKEILFLDDLDAQGRLPRKYLAPGRAITAPAAVLRLPPIQAELTRSHDEAHRRRDARVEHPGPVHRSIRAGHAKKLRSKIEKARVTFAASEADQCIGNFEQLVSAVRAQ